MPSRKRVRLARAGPARVYQRGSPHPPPPGREDAERGRRGAGLLPASPRPRVSASGAGSERGEPRSDDWGLIARIYDLPGRRFGSVYVALNSFWLLTDLAAQRACLACVARHLAPGGRVVLALFPPNQDDYRQEFGIVQYLP